ncbi:MAG: hypothetical protein DRP30_06955 [Thermotoga sp.]|nr:MAG: hypothetical protein DRP30_06955 [Thermotoga sp.]HDM70745.1 sugar ABC transporter permease [Thermotogales bacterium]
MRNDRGWRFVIPSVILLGFVALFPFIFSLYISFTESTAYNIYHGKFVGLGNYISLFKDIKFWDSLRVTLLYVALSVSIEMILGFFLALLVDSLDRYQRLFMILLIIPMMIAPLVYGIIFKLLYNSIYGPIPLFFRSAFNIELQILNKPFRALLAMVIVDVFQWTSFVFLITYSALQALPKEPFEAAMIDGATYWKRVRYVLLPLIRPAFVVIMIFRLMDSFKTFDQIFVITGGGPGTATTTLSLYTYFLMFTRYNFGKAAALTVIILMVVIVITNLVFKRFFREVSAVE